MLTHSTIRKQVVEELLGDVAPLAEQIGSADGLLALSRAASRGFHQVKDLPSLRGFLRDYQALVLVPVELPTIRRAHEYAHRYEIRELLEMDRQLADEPVLRSFAAASQRVGKTQLKRLRPLRDQRLVQRYLRAVEAGEANAWHTVVYGLILSLYSLPLRQGLLGYAHQTTLGFIRTAAGPLKLTADQWRKLADEVSAGLPEAVDRLLEISGPTPLIG
jgi:urease accessory protein UreF